MRASGVRWLRFFTEPRHAGEAALPGPAHVASFLMALGLLAALFYFSFLQLRYHWSWAPVAGYWRLLLAGWVVTLLLSVSSLVFSTFFGVLAALARRSRFLPLRYVSMVCIELVRGTPLLVQILIFFYVIADAMGVQNRYWVGVLTLSIFAGAYIAEMVRAGIESIAASQLESARAVGFTMSQTYRHVIFPQAMRQILPPLAGQFVSLIKDSSLLSIISISEFTLSARQVNAFTYSTLESYLPLAAGYLLLTLPISLWTRWLERRFRYEH